LFQAQTYAVALSLMLVTMVCWGSWANTMKLCPGYRFQLFYWDYVIGLILAALISGFTLGSMGGVGGPFVADLLAADFSHITLGRGRSWPLCCRHVLHDRRSALRHPIQLSIDAKTAG
jgi:glucose uptake protein